MTIDELLEVAQAHTKLAALGITPETQPLDAAIASAAATTALAMILRKATTIDTKANPGDWLMEFLRSETQNTRSSTGWDRTGV